eukprot:TRINITY_DN1202_c0_g1_i14.p1 TRINITY_DN1202_c0_g1~~TRINITY_DN1202_c0_g1_i14.p1  ORF type:complete len:508 (-),score=94.48 TRINITY_DN1202_c0_g1_i14:42-1565(-)
MCIRDRYSTANTQEGSVNKGLLVIEHFLEHIEAGRYIPSLEYCREDIFRIQRNILGGIEILNINGTDQIKSALTMIGTGLQEIPILLSECRNITSDTKQLFKSLRNKNNKKALSGIIFSIVNAFFRLDQIQDQWRAINHQFESHPPAQIGRDLADLLNMFLTFDPRLDQALKNYENSSNQKGILCIKYVSKFYTRGKDAYMQFKTHLEIHKFMTDIILIGLEIKPAIEVCKKLVHQGKEDKPQPQPQPETDVKPEEKTEEKPKEEKKQPENPKEEPQKKEEQEPQPDWTQDLPIDVDSFVDNEFYGQSKRLLQQVRDGEENTLQCIKNIPILLNNIRKIIQQKPRTPQVAQQELLDVLRSYSYTLKDCGFGSVPFDLPQVTQAGANIQQCASKLSTWNKNVLNFTKSFLMKKDHIKVLYVIFESLLNEGVDTLMSCGLVRGKGFHFTLQEPQCFENARMIIDNYVILVNDVKESGVHQDFKFLRQKVRDLIGNINSLFKSCARKNTL